MTTESRKRGFPRQIVIAALALLLEAGAIGLLMLIVRGAYCGNRSLSEEQVVPLTNAVLALAGPVCLLLGAAGSYLLVLRSRWWAATPLVALLSFPVILSSSILTYALAIFLCLA